MTSAVKRKKAFSKVKIKSMTGFGKGEEKYAGGTISAEIKTFNHRTLSVVCNLFDGFFLLEQKVQKLFEGKVFRGKVFVKIHREESGDHKKDYQAAKINEKVAKEYLKKIKKIQKNLGIKGELKINELLTFPGVMESVKKKKEKDPWPHIAKALEKALIKLIKYRETEGARLAKDFNMRLRRIEANLRDIKKHEKQSVAAYRVKLSKLIKDVIKKKDPDRGKLEAEVALFARNCDITEERIRLKGHIDEYRSTMNNVKTDIGKKMDFIAQEMQREINTIGAKSGDFNISRAVIDIKSEVEKIREQIKNIE